MIDSKIDDGLPFRGAVRASAMPWTNMFTDTGVLYAANNRTCIKDDAAPITASTYNVGATGSTSRCAPFIVAGF